MKKNPPNTDEPSPLISLLLPAFLSVSLTHTDLSTHNSTQGCLLLSACKCLGKIIYDVMCVCVLPLSPAIKKNKTKVSFNVKHSPAVLYCWVFRILVLTVTIMRLCVLSPFHRVWLGATPWTVASLLCPWGSPGKNPGVGCHAQWNYFPSRIPQRKS